MFLTRGLLRNDCNQPYCKERFLSRLQKLFSEWVKNSIRKNNNNSIPYDKLTFGDLITFVNQEEIALAMNPKLKSN